MYVVLSDRQYSGARLVDTMFYTQDMAVCVELSGILSYMIAAVHLYARGMIDRNEVVRAASQVRRWYAKVLAFVENGYSYIQFSSEHGAVLRAAIEKEFRDTIDTFNAKYTG